MQKEIEWPEEGDGEDQSRPEAKDFLAKLLIRDPKQRLGA